MKSEEDLARRDTLLENLRSLSSSHPEDAGVREHLAMGLYNTLNDANSEGDPARRDVLLEELRVLSSRHPEDAGVREQLAMGLFNTLNYAKSEGDPARRDSLLEELRKLHHAHPHEPIPLLALTKGVGVLLKDLSGEELERRRQLEEELGRLQERLGHLLQEE